MAENAPPREVADPALAAMTTEPRPVTAAGLAELHAALVSVTGPQWVFADDRARAYRVEDLTPPLAVAPADPDEVAAVLALADSVRGAVVPWGGGTAMALGYPPRAADLVVDLRRLNRVLRYEPADLTVSVGAGVTLAALDAVLAGRGQRLALDGAHPERATVGGLVATNQAGPRRHRHGGARDLLIGIRVAHPDGTLTRGGGMVVKNVSGYDMMKLYCGSLGTLALIVELNCKLAPRPTAQRTALVAFPSADDALHAADALLASQLQPSACVVLERAVAAGLGVSPADGPAGRAGAALAVSFEGLEVTVNRQVRDVRDRAAAGGGLAALQLDLHQARAFWAGLLEFQAPDAAPLNAALLKLSALPTDLPAVLHSAHEISAQVDLRCMQYADAASGIVYLRVGQPEDRLPAVFAWALWALQTELVRRWGQSVVLSCPTEAKQNLPLWGREPAGLPVMRELKARFDPRGILNPGRFVGRI